MAEAIDIENFNIESTAQHLQKGPFAPIFEQSDEKDNPIALKLMCIVDYYAQRWDLYTSIQGSNSLKLLQQLMQFRSYGSFKYYDYPASMGKRVLQCKFCDLTASYGLILTHMAINHNAHIGMTMCNYCNSTELKRHFDQNSMGECYANYIQRNGIEVNETVCKIVVDFYAMLKKISDKFKITTVRNNTFTGKGYSVVERLDRDYDSDVDQHVTVYTSRTPMNKKKTITGHLAELDREFGRVISNLYGGNNASRLMQQQQQQPANAVGSETIVISDDDDGVDGDDNASSAVNCTLHSAFKAEHASGEGTSTGSAAPDADTNDSMTMQTGIKPEPTAMDSQNAHHDSTKTTLMVHIPMAQAHVSSQVNQTENRTSNSEPFLQLIAQRLDQTSDNSKRRKLENAILEAIVSAEKE